MTTTNQAPLSEQLSIFVENQPGLDKLIASLPGYRSASMPLLELAAGACGPYESQEAFERLALVSVERPVRIYTSPDFCGELIVPEDYAIALARVRSLRLVALQSGLADAGGASAVMSSAEAQAELEQCQYRNRLLPEELLYYLKELPDRGYFSQVYLLDGGNPRDLWLKQLYQNSGFISAMEVTRKTGELRLFKTERNEFLRSNLVHEWAHQLEVHTQPDEWQFFSDAVAIEWAFYVPDSYALKSYEEHWAVVGQDLLHPEGARFLTMAQKAPIRTVAFMAVLERELNALPEARRSPFHESLLARCRYVKEQVVPQAKDNLAVALRAAARLQSLVTQTQSGAADQTMA